MQFKVVNTLKIEEYIKCAWDSDNELGKFYDRSLQKRNLEGMVRDTSRKIRDMMELDEKLSLLGIEFENKSIGFIVLSEKLSMLYSFGVNVEYRKKEILSSIFNYIKARLNYEFYSVMYEYNTRAINWLLNCGLEIDPIHKPSHDTIYLKYEICQ